LKLLGVFRFIQTEIDKTRNFYREFGLWKTILRFIENIGVFKRRVFTFLEMELKDSISVQEQNHGINLARVGKEDLEKVGQYLYKWFEKEEAMKRLEAGNVLLVVKDEEKMVFYQWIEFAKIDLPYLNLSFFIPDGTACMAYMYTKPEYRRKGIASKAKPLVFKFLRKNGILRAFSVIAPNNAESLRINKKFGFKEYQTVIYWRLLFLKYYCVKDFHTDSQKVFWGSGRATQELWKTFSKIGLDRS
jgi:RimJ/RimL family protein N-acetyltransferase